MGRQLDEGASQMLTDISRSNGIDIHAGVQIASIEGESSVTGVKLADGREFPAELVIVSAGVRANVGAAKMQDLTLTEALW